MRQVDDEPVFVIDLRLPTSGEGADAATPLETDEAIALVAILDEGEPRLFRIEPTHDGRYLDALARLIRFAHARGESVRAIAERYGTEYERALLFEGRIPAWAMEEGRRRRDLS